MKRGRTSYFLQLYLDSNELSSIQVHTFQNSKVSEMLFFFRNSQNRQLQTNKHLKFQFHFLDSDTKISPFFWKHCNVLMCICSFGSLIPTTTCAVVQQRWRTQRFHCGGRPSTSTFDCFHPEHLWGHSSFHMLISSTFPDESAFLKPVESTRSSVLSGRLTCGAGGDSGKYFPPLQS